MCQPSSLNLSNCTMLEWKNPASVVSPPGGWQWRKQNYTSATRWRHHFVDVSMMSSMSWSDVSSMSLCQEMLYLLCPYVMKWYILHVLISWSHMSLCHEVMCPCQHVMSCHRLSLKIEPLPTSPEGKSTVSRAKEGLELIVDSPSRCDSPKHCPGGTTEVSSLYHRKANSLGARWVRLYTLNHRSRRLYL